MYCMFATLGMVLLIYYVSEQLRIDHTRVTDLGWLLVFITERTKINLKPTTFVL